MDKMSKEIFLSAVLLNLYEEFFRNLM